MQGKEAGLGDEEQVDLVVSATAECINQGQKHPKAANKGIGIRGRHVPGAERQGQLRTDLTASFKPECSPPMTVVFSGVTVVDVTNGISKSLGSF